MIENISVIDRLTDFSCWTIFIVLFYKSLKNCFWNGQKKKRSLILLSFFANPLVICMVGMIFILYGAFFTFQMMGKNIYVPPYSTIFAVLVSFSATLMLPGILIFARLMAKWLDVKNRELVYFVYLSFGVIVALLLRGDITGFGDNLVAAYLVDAAANVILIVAIFLFYFTVIRSLADLTNRDYTADNRTFIVPPALFIFVYTIISSSSVVSANVMTELLVYAFSSIMLYVFIWAFYVITKNIRASADNKTLSVEVMEALAHTIDAKDEYTKGHSVRVAKYSKMLAERMELDPAECENVYYMGLLHDIGKIGVPNEIINSKSRLSDEEFAVIQTHPGLGYEILAEIKSRPDLAVGARWHHERYDGKGYPEGKNGEEIPLEARIIAVADSYDAMTSNRSYRNYLPQEKVREEILKNAGTQFDPKAAKTMVEIIDEDKDYTMHE